MRTATGCVVDLADHSPLLERAVRHLLPERVFLVAVSEPTRSALEELRAAHRFEFTDSLTDADLVLSGASDYRTVRDLLDTLRQHPPAVIVSGIGWPCGRRDARLDIAGLPRSERRRFAYRQPIPGRVALGARPSPVAFANLEGGAQNGVLTAVEDGTRAAPDAWAVRSIEASGGVAILLPKSQATPDRWLALLPSDYGREISERLERSIVELRLERLQLLAELESDRADGSMTDEARDLLEVASRTGPRIEVEIERRREAEQRLIAALREADVRVEHERNRWESLRHNLETGSGADLYRSEHEYILEQVRMIASSEAWRWGHRLANAARLITFRRGRGTDAATRLVERMETTAAGD